MDEETQSRLYAACRPDEPIAPDDPRHFDFDQFGLRGRPWRTKLAKIIRITPEPTAQVITGLPGSGKTTELMRLRAELTRQGCHVVLADAGAWIRDDRPIAVEDLWLAMVLSVYPDGGPDAPVGWLADYAKRAWAFLQSKVHIKDLGLSLGPIKLRTELSSNDTLFARASKVLREGRDLRQDVFALLEHAAAGARAAGTRLVLILDGVEKRATGSVFGSEEQSRYRNHWFDAFLTRARDLKPPVDVVYTVPPFMIRRASELGAQFGQELEFLPMVRIWQRQDEDGGKPRPDQIGLRAMREALLLRVPRACFADEAAIDRLVRFSGGYMRDLLRLASHCVLFADETESIDGELVESALVRIRQTYLEGLRQADVGLLTQVQRTKSFPQNEQTAPFMDRLLQSYTMMRYHNSHFWYGAHPLLWSEIGVAGP